MSTPEIAKLEEEIMLLNQRLEKMRRDVKPVKVKNYTFKTVTGEVSLLDLFGDKDVLFMIHNMGQGCRYCTLWADGLNAFIPHLEDRFAVALVSKDAPELQRRFANSRGWRFNMASHGGGEYMKDQAVRPGDAGNWAGMVVYTREGDQIFRKNAATFGPGDMFCSLWSMLSVAGLGEEQFHPQFRYWKNPEKMEDGGAPVLN